MRKIPEPSDVDSNSLKGNARNLSDMDEDAVVRHRTSDTRVDFWSREDDGLPSMDHTPPSMRRSRPNTNAAPLGGNNATLRHIIDSEDQDFSELSLLASTPAAIKPARDHRLSNDSEDGATGRRNAGGYRRNLLSERSPNRETKQARTRETLSNLDDDIPRTANLSRAETRLTARIGRVGNKENERLTDTDDGYAKDRRAATIPDRTARAVTFRQHQRPGSTWEDSRQRLQRLATSLSPSPGKSSSEAAPFKTDDVERESHKEEVRQKRAPTDEMNSNLPIVRTARRRYTNTRQDESQRQTKSERHSEEVQAEPVPAEETPAYGDEEFDDKPPVNNVAKSDAPRRSTETRPLLRSSDADLIRALGKPTNDAKSISDNTRPDSSTKGKENASGNTQRAKSALEDIVREARKDPNGPFGDATLQSLEDIAHPNIDPTDTSLTFDTATDHAENADETLDIGRPLTQAEKDRRQEDLAIESMNKHLRAARTSIKDAGRGLRRVENKWESSSPVEVTQAELAGFDTRGDTKSGPNQQTICTRCSGSYQGIWKGLWTEFRSNFYVHDRKARFGIRLTWLGLLTTIFLLWHLVENLLCWQYCHPLYAETMIGYGVDPDAPRYPFVIPTLLFRPFRPIWKPALAWLHASFMTVFYMVFGDPPPKEVPRYMQPDFEMTEDMINWHALMPREKPSQAWDSTWASKAATTAAAVAGKVTRSFVDAVDDVGRINDDEYM